ncbi:MAG: hypothetical protein NTY44_13165 [Deltaproteobacteria bacterium]|nr:hypothetical protein [Deltaproteobacteria bacterium]
MEETESWRQVKDRRKIQEIFERMVSKNMELKVLIDEENVRFMSRATRLNPEEISSLGSEPELIIEKLFPEIGNSLIQSSSQVTLEFSIKEHFCRGKARYVGVSNEYPYFGIMITLPQSLELARERRRERRHTYEMPDFVSVAFSIVGKDKVYDLGVMDCSMHGLGILVTRKDFDLVRLVKPGDRIRDIVFYSENAMIKVDGVVRHLTKMSAGKYKNSYVMGIESPEVIENCKLASQTEANNSRAK